MSKRKQETKIREYLETADNQLFKGVKKLFAIYYLRNSSQRRINRTKKQQTHAKN